MTAKVNKWIIRIMVIWLIICGGHWAASQSHNETSRRRGVDPIATSWTMVCGHIQGMDIGRPGFQDGRSDVFITLYSKKAFSFSRYFYTDGPNGIGNFFWDKENGFKDGTWVQEYPYDHGKWSLEGNPETGFSGWLTNKDGQKMVFWLIAKH